MKIKDIKIANTFTVVNPINTVINPIYKDEKFGLIKDFKPTDLIKAKMTKVYIYCDGACKGNPGRGGYGGILKYKDKEKEFFGGELETTNNKMELVAAIKAFEQLKRPCEVEVYTDSKYVIDGVTNWSKSWIKNNWKNAKKEPVKNMELWKELLSIISIHNVKWNWVKGHSGHPENERADQLANKGAYSI